ncbi:MAG: alpha-amylase family glycosyl hydrolase [Gemmatimonadota bacterium]
MCYEVFVRSFLDSDGDGIGDLRGLIRKLDYINDGNPETLGDLGANCIWLMPIAASTSYHGYDVRDYYRVDPSYGTQQDFQELVREAHARGIRVLVDMVINHTSSEYPFFQYALLYPDSPYRDWFRFSSGRGEPNEWGGYNWHRSPYRDEYYYGFFWSGMPDLNWESPEVRAEMKRVATFWLTEMGADGFRLDAVRHLMEEGDRTANVPRTHDMLREYQAHIRKIAPDAFTIGEVFDSTDVLLAYYPDQLDSYFAFQVANAILDAVVLGTADHLMSTVLELQTRVPDHRWAPFLRNHDQTRTMTQLEGRADRAALAAEILLTLPGLPFVYYGEEIGMTGDKPDPRLRTPMQWDLTPAAGFTSGIPWEPPQPDSFTANVAAMEGDPASLLNRYRRMIHLRSGNRALGSGDLVPLRANVPGVAAYLRTTGKDAALVVANLGDRPIRGVNIGAADRAETPEPSGYLEAGRYSLTPLLRDAPQVGDLTVGSDGRISSLTPVPSLPPLTLYVYGLSRN